MGVTEEEQRLNYQTYHGLPTLSVATVARAALLLGLAIAATPAFAADPITSVGEPIGIRDASGLELSGNWARIYPADDGGWQLFVTGGDTYNVMEMDAAFNVTSDRRRLVEDWPQRLVDHQIAACPDGTWLHVASANVTVPNDSAYLFRYDEDLNLVCSATIAESDPVLRYNDAPLVCTGGATADDPMDGTATHSEGDLERTPFLFFDENCEPSAQEPHPANPSVTGTSILWDEERGGFWQIRTTPDDFPVLFQLYGPWMEPVDKSYSVDTLVPEGYTTHWPQAAVQVGDYYIVAHLARAPGVIYNSDKGDLWLQVFDRGFNHVQAVEVTTFTDGGGAQRPWLSARGDQLVLVYDDDLWPHRVDVTLNLEVLMGEEPDETDEPGIDTGPSGEEDPAEHEPAEGAPSTPAASDGSRSEASGCSTAGGAGGRALAGLMFGLMGLWGRRRR